MKIGIEKLKAMIAEARDAGRAIPAYDTISYLQMDYAAAAAKEAGTPMMFMYLPLFEEIISPKEFVALKDVLQEKYGIPLITHLDHSKSIDLVERVIDAGFDSVMIDMSDRSFEENVRVTKEVVSIAHPRDVIVEAEIGHVGSGSRVEDYQDSSLYTNVDEAAAFSKETGVELLAVAIGNSHGVYVETPHLDIARLKELRAAVETPLVLHGTSLIPEDQVADAVRNGIVKVNLCTEMVMAEMEAIEAGVKAGAHKSGGLLFTEKCVKPAMMEYFRNKIAVLMGKG